MFCVVKNYAKRTRVSASPAERCWLRVMGTLNEYQARLFVAEKALEIGRGGTSRLSKLTGMSRVTITSGLTELRGGKRLRVAGAGRVRAPGGGRKKVEEADPALQRRLKAIVEETTAGDPMSPLKWTSKSTRTMAEELERGGHPVSNVTVARCLAGMGYTLQANVNGYSPDLIEPGRLTMPLMLKQHGYFTCGVGKWHLGLGTEEKTDFSKPLRPGPMDHGFDYYFGIPASLDMAPYLYFENDHVVEQPSSLTPGSKEPRGVFWRPGPIAPHLRLEDVLPTIASKAVGLTHDHMGKGKPPMFLYCALPAPHTPWLPLPAYRGRSKAGDYGDYVAEVDDMLGGILSAVKESGEEDNTIFIFTSDNGADWKIEDLARYAHRANAHWRGEKADIWEAGHRIPFLIRWPGHIRAGSVSGELGCLTDVMASVAAINGVKLPDNAAEDSYDLSQAFLGRNGGPIRPDIIDHSIDGMFAMRRGKWKLKEGLGSGGFSAPKRVDPAPGGPKGQLYDLSKDPHELDNLYQKRPEIVDELSTLLEKYRQQGYTRPSPGN